MTEDNHGVINGAQRRPTDYVGGTLEYKVRNESGDWSNFLPLGEWQWKAGKDTMACVTFSLLNAIETQEFFLTGKRVNYSDRWIAMMSGTTINGNYLYLVADAVRKYGLVLEDSWPAPASFDWNTYYAKPNPTQMAALEAEGKQWKTTHDFAYEWLTNSLADLQKHLKQCPLQVVIPGHAIEEFSSINEIVNYFDSYDPFKKWTERSNLTDVLKPLLTMKGEETLRLVNDNGTYYLVGEKAKLGITDLSGLGLFKKLTDKEEQGTADVPSIGTFGIQLGVDLD